MRTEMGGYAHLNGSARFQVATCIGNWYEERELRRSILKDLLGKKMTGTLRLDAYHQRMSTALAEVELTKIADDGYVHVGDLVQLVHLETGSTVAGDVSDQDPRPGEEACAATAAGDVRSPCARNTFVITKYKPSKAAALEPYYDDDILRYGQKIRLALNPQAMGLPLDATGGQRPMCLFSKPLSMTHYAKYSRKQLVGLTARDTFDTVWQVLTPDPAARVISEGVEVMAGAPILLVHAATQKPLIVEAEQRYPNEFGVEYELSARQSTGKGLKLAMEQTAKGLLKGSIPKGEDSLNYFTFITGSKVEALPAAPPPDTASADAALHMFVGEVSSKPGGFSLLEKKLVTWANRDNELPADELLLLVRQCGSQLPEPDVQALGLRFSGGRPGMLDAGALLQSARAAAGVGR